MNAGETLVLEIEAPAFSAPGGSSPVPSSAAESFHLESEPGRLTPYGAVAGVLVGFSDKGLPLVDFPDNPSTVPVPARTTVLLTPNETNREVVLLFEGNDLKKPILMGLLQSAQGLPAGGPSPAPAAEPRPEELVLTADKEIVLRCGKASITLTRAGKVLIRGAYLLSRSSGVNRIKGGSVQIN
jgi:hypothetical protein